jgi:hypothetical protein
MSFLRAKDLAVLRKVSSSVQSVVDEVATERLENLLRMNVKRRSKQTPSDKVSTTLVLFFRLR